MAITAEQEKKRQNYYGSSDIAAIFNLDPFRNAHDLYLQKTGKLEPAPTTKIMKRGHFRELGLLAFAEDELGPLECDPDRLEFCDEELRLIDHPDAIVLASGNPVEAKSQGYFAQEFWGKEDTDQIPDRAILQAHVHMICTDKDYCHIPYDHPIREYLMFGVALDLVLRDHIAEAVTEFHERHIVRDIPPAILPSPDVVKQVIRVPKKSVQVDAALYAKAKADREARLATEKAEEISSTALRAALGDAEVGICGAESVTYYEQSRDNIDSKSLRVAEPLIAARFTTTSKCRVMRFTKGK
jgi:predicted phage-related endonuclease